MRLNKDQIGHLMSALWIQASLSDNLPSNIEAISHSFTLTLISSRLKVTCQISTYRLNYVYFLDRVNWLVLEEIHVTLEGKVVLLKKKKYGYFYFLIL